MSNPVLPFPDQYLSEVGSGHNLTQGDPREYGVDLNMPRGTVLVAPADSTVVGYTPSGSGGLGPQDWFPGRLLLRDDSNGNVVYGFGHVISSLPPGTHVHAGDPIARIGADPAEGDHLEFMIFQGGLGRSNVVDPRGFLLYLGKSFPSNFSPGDVLSGAASVATAPFRAIGSIADAVKWLFAPGRFWQLGMTLGGVLLIGVGVFMLMKDHAPSINISRDLVAAGA